MSYIEKEALLAKQETIELPDPNGGEYHIDIIHAYDVRNAPTADVVEVRHGEWGFDGLGWTCSECGEYALSIKTNLQSRSKYCPNCGAKMDGERREQ